LHVGEGPAVSQDSPRAELTLPSPQNATVQSALQLAVWPEVSHCSPVPGSTMPLPHISSERQSAEQPSPLTLLPSSQTSPFAGWTFPLPQVDGEAALPAC